MKNILLLLSLSFLFSGISLDAKALSFSHKIDSIQITFDKQQLIIPGESFTIGVIAYLKNGKAIKTKGLEDGSVFWWNYKVEVIGGNCFSGRISVDKLNGPVKGNFITIKAYPRKQPELAKELTIPLNYETSVSFKPTNQFDKSGHFHFLGSTPF